MLLLSTAVVQCAAVTHCHLKGCSFVLSVIKKAFKEKKFKMTG